jgi:tetratricopeptide (TPR) repeat protein
MIVRDMSSERRQFIQRTQNTIAVEYVMLALSILERKTVAKPEDFNGRLMPVSIAEQSADLVRFALTINPNCDLAHYNLGILILSQNVRVQIVDNLGELLFSNNKGMQAAVFFRRAIALNPDSGCAVNALAMLIGSHNVIAKSTDFIDGVLPDTLTKQITTLFRRAHTAVPSYFKASYHLGKLIENYFIDAEPGDFDDQLIPETKVEQAAKLYRQVLQKNVGCPEANASLGLLISKGLIKSLATDFLPEEMPDSVIDQGGLLFRRALVVFVDCSDGLLGMASLIASKKLIPTKLDCELLGLNSTASTAEQAAVLYRKVMKSDKLAIEAKLELAELMLAKEVKPELGDTTPEYNSLLPLSMHLEMMMKNILHFKPDCIAAENFIKKIEIKAKEKFAQDSARIAQLRAENDERVTQRRREAELRRKSQTSSVNLSMFPVPVTTKRQKRKHSEDKSVVEEKTKEAKLGIRL